jgi:hypothetical protein
MYTPVSNIISSGFTNGGDFIIKSNGQSYSGYYFTTTDNKFYTGQTWTSNSVELESVSQSSNTNIFGGIYSTLNPNSLPKTAFTADFIIPTQQDYNNGYFIRFVLKPTISTRLNDFIEVKSDKYNQVIQSNDLQTLYKFANVTWKLTGPLHDTYKDNIRIASGIIDTNKRSIQEAEKFIPNLSLYFTDLIQFGKPS